MKQCWYIYGKNKKQTNEQKDDDGVVLHVDDEESLFGDPVSALKMQIMMASMSHPEYNASDLMELFGDALGHGREDRESVRQIINEVITQGVE